MIVSGTKTSLFAQRRLITEILVISLLYQVKTHRGQSSVLSAKRFCRRQAAAEDNNPQLSTQLPQVSGELGINTSHSEAKKINNRWFCCERKRDGNVKRQSRFTSAFKAADLSPQLCAGDKGHI